MTANRPGEFTPDELVERRIAQARFVTLLLAGDGRERLVAKDADSGELVRIGIPEAPPGAIMRPRSLSWDGTRLLVRSWPIDRPGHRLMLHTLATGEQQWLAPELDADSVALSPDGCLMAALSDDETEVWVSVTDLASGERRRVWTSPGLGGAQSGVSWSPDGRLLVATYLTLEDLMSTVVVEASDGRVVAHYEGMERVGSPNGSWAGQRELLLSEELCEDPSPPLLLQDVITGTTRPIYQVPGPMDGYYAVVGKRLVRGFPDGLYSCELDSSDPRPLLGRAPGFDFGFFDVSAEF